MAKSELTVLQRRILAILEEAGSENVPTLMNTIIATTGRSAEVAAIRTALDGLLRAGYIDIAQSREDSTLQWMAVPKAKALPLLEALACHLVWSDSKRSWSKGLNQPDMQVLDTDAGKIMAQKILSKEGFPPANAKLKIG